MSFQIHKNHRMHKLEIQYRQRKCLHLYHYQIHPIFGFMHTRIQTKLPFRVYVACLNAVVSGWPGRWTRPDCATCVMRQHVHLAGRPRPAQALLDQQRRPTGRSCWTPALWRPTPAQSEILRFPRHYYWSVSDSEWASDVLFPSPEALATVYPRLLRYAITTSTPVDVMRFWANRCRPAAKSPMPAATRSAATSRNAGQGRH